MITQQDNGIFNKTEIQWIEKQEHTLITYSINNAIDLDLDMFLNALSQMTKLNFSEAKDHVFIMIDIEELLNSEDYTTIKTIGQLGFSCYSSRVDIDKTEDLNLYKIGMLQLDSRTLNLTNEYGINPTVIDYYDDEETMMAAYIEGELDVIILKNLDYSLIIEGQVVVNRIWELYLEQDQVLLAARTEEVILQSILSKAITKMDQTYGLSNLVSNFDYSDYKNQFLSLLTEEERAYLKNTPILNSGLVLEHPITYQQGDKLYGIPIGILSDISNLTGITFNYILGEEEKLIH